ncbi:MAG: PfkB family carbohydrate kinase [bacterium]
MNLRPERLAELLDGFAGRRVLVVGDLVADEYVYGETTRVSREAPVLILRHVGRRVIPGGAGNAMLNLAALDAVAVPVALLGVGETSSLVIAELAARGVDASGIVRDAERVAVRKTRVMAGGPHGQKQQILRIDQDDLSPVSAGAGAKLRETALAQLGTCEAVLMSDYGYGTLAPAVRDAVLREARRRGVPVCADSRYALREFSGVTYATPNADEAQAAWGRPIRGEDDLRAAGEALRASLDAEFLLLTRGHDGMAVCERSGAFTSYPVWGEAEAADVTGAGDTVAAASLLALLAGASPREAAQVATIAAGIVVQKHGAATTTREEIERVAGIRREAPKPR